MSSEPSSILPQPMPVVIDVQNVSKHYHIYGKPSDRLRQFLRSLWGRITRRTQPPLYKNFHALSDISLQIRRGETVGIIGRNGSGKSTLLQIICGTLTPSSGTVGVQGRVAALLELGSGFNPEFTGRENVYLNASILGLSHEQTAARFDSIAQFADIGDFIEQPVKTYSSGMAVRLAFAVIAHVDADVLIVDEALAVGDALFTQKCMRFLRNFMQHGTVLFVSHDIEAVKALCQRVVWLSQGRPMRDGETRQVCQDYLDSLFAHQQGKNPLAVSAAAPSGTPTISATSAAPPPQPPHAGAAATPLPVRDPRADLINRSTLRNDIKVFSFDPHGAAYQSGQARITHAALVDADGHPLPWVVGGELVCLRMQAVCSVDLGAPVMGFIVKDRMGQSLFGDNTGLRPLNRAQPARAGDTLRADFIFEMPRLPTGDYSVALAIANEREDEYTHLHWIHDGINFHCQGSSILSGLIGIPMRQITVVTLPPPSA